MIHTIGMMTDDAPSFKLKRTLASDSPADGDDVVKTKNALAGLGRYNSPIGAITPYTDSAMFDGLKGFQKDEGLKVDGIAKPGGPTETALDAQVTGLLSDAGLKGRPASGGETGPQEAAPRSRRPRIAQADPRDIPDRADLSDWQQTPPMSPADPASSTRQGEPESQKSSESDNADDRDATVNWAEKPAVTKWRVSGQVTEEPIITSGPIRVDLRSPTLGLDGIDYDVVWRPLDETGKIEEPEAQPEPQRYGSHVGSGFSPSQTLVPPYENPDGWAVEIYVPPQPPRNGASLGVDMSIFTPVK